MGFFIEDGQLKSTHNDKEGHSILSDISQKIEQKEITTRKNRGKVIEVLEPSSQQIIDKNRTNKAHPSSIVFGDSKEEIEKKQLSRRTPKKAAELFGGKLYLRMGQVSNLYRDILDLHNFYLKEKKRLSQTFPSLIRMALRLLCETAAKDKNTKLENYIKSNFQKAKKTLSQDIKTTLASQNVTENSIVQLLHTGAHSYEASSNIEQTIALSIIIGAMITITHGKDE